MAWLNTNTQDTKDTTTEFLKFAALENVGDADDIKMRILNESPTSVWQHWLKNRPFNCLGTQACPVCVARNRARKAGGDAYKNDFRLSYRGMFNVLVRDERNEPVVKVFGFGPGVEKNLKAFYDKYGDLRGYYISIRKRKTGPRQQDVEYVLFYEGKADERESTDSLELYDLDKYIQPASIEDLVYVARGELPPERESSQPESSGMDVFAPGADNLLAQFEAVASKKNMTLAQFGIDGSKPLSDRDRELVQALIKQLTDASE